MSRIKSISTPVTHGGSQSASISPLQQLRRSVMSCLLWEDEFYESSKTISARIAELVPQIDAENVAKMAIDARTNMKLRHVPLLLVREMARYKTHSSLVSSTLTEVIQRMDEIAEYVAIYWKDGKCPLSAQSKKGLAEAFPKFSRYNGARNMHLKPVSLRDVMRMVHPEPKDEEQAAWWKLLADGSLRIDETTETWQYALSKNDGIAKKDKWERLIKEEKLGALDILRNIRNMEQEGIDERLISEAIARVNLSKVLPHQFLAAAKHNPKFENIIETAMLKTLESTSKLYGKTIFVVDVSGSMYDARISSKSEITRTDVANTLAMLLREVCETPVIYATAGNDRTEIHNTAIVPPRRGFALTDYIYNQRNPLGGGGIFLKQVIDYVKEKEKIADRIIVITDEQDCDHNKERSPLNAKPFGKHNYLINVASNKHGIGYGEWTHIDGWSDYIIDYIRAIETEG